MRMKRGGLFFFYDGDGIVDDYILYLLNDIKKSLDYLLVVVNGKLDSEGQDKLNRVANHVLIRENKELDVGAYKEGLHYMGWDCVTGFDEFIFFNHTNYGPVYPFSEMFDTMDKRKVDFWGITKHNGHNYDPYQRCEYGYIPAHIQSSFIAVRQSMLQDAAFQSYWDTMRPIQSYEDSICYHEAVFTEKFTRLGFQSDVYVNTEDLVEFADYPLMIFAKELIQNRRCPIFKRKMFFNVYDEFMDVTCGQPGMELYDYLCNHTDYDMNLVWDNMLRTANVYDIKQRMQLNYILPKDFCKENNSKSKKTAAFLHLYYLDMIDECKRYLDNMPSDADIYITTNEQAKKDMIEKAFQEFGGRKVTVVLVENRGREYAGFYIALQPYYAQYEYICLLHTKKSCYDKPFSIGESFKYHCFENTLTSESFIKNVLTTFEQNPRLGLLVPPTPSHGPYYSTIGREWKSNFERTKMFAQQLGIKAMIEPNKPPIAPLGNFCWIRTAAFHKLFDYPFTYDSFPKEPCMEKDGSIMHAMERIYPFVAQDAGFYTGWLISDDYCRTMVTNLYKTVREFNEGLFWVYGEMGKHDTMKCLYEALEMANPSAPVLSKRQRIKVAAKMLLGEKWYERCNCLRKKLMRRT